MQRAQKRFSSPPVQLVFNAFFAVGDRAHTDRAREAFQRLLDRLPPDQRALFNTGQVLSMQNYFSLSALKATSQNAIEAARTEVR